MAKKRHTVEVIEYPTGFAVRHIATGKEHWMGDGVDTLFTKTGRQAMRPGDKTFRQRWEQYLNQDIVETMAAYFPHVQECPWCGSYKTKYSGTFANPGHGSVHTCKACGHLFASYAGRSKPNARLLELEDVK